LRVFWQAGEGPAGGVGDEVVGALGEGFERGAMLRVGGVSHGGGEVALEAFAAQALEWSSAKALVELLRRKIR
jgi:hypothetical protein